MSKTIVLVSCVKTKRSHACKAKDRYISTLFRAQREFAERWADEWYVLSALHGLVEPEQIIAPYEKTLTRASVDEKRAWSRRVVETFFERSESKDRVIITAGESYCRFLEPELLNRGHVVWRPLKGLSMGFQPGRLRSLTSAEQIPWNV
jgi:uncharacterized protein DUF6884